MINVSTQELYRIIDELDSSTSFAPPLPFEFKIEFLEKNNSKIQVSLLIHALIKFNFFFFQFSNKLNKLYIICNYNCKLCITSENEPPIGSKIRLRVEPNNAIDFVSLVNGTVDGDSIYCNYQTALTLLFNRNNSDFGVKKSVHLTLEVENK